MSSNQGNAYGGVGGPPGGNRGNMGGRKAHNLTASNVYFAGGAGTHEFQGIEYEEGSAGYFEHGGDSYEHGKAHYHHHHGGPGAFYGRGHRQYGRYEEHYGMDGGRYGDGRGGMRGDVDVFNFSLNYRHQPESNVEQYKSLLVISLRLGDKRQIRVHVFEFDNIVELGHRLVAYLMAHDMIYVPQQYAELMSASMVYFIESKLAEIGFSSHIYSAFAAEFPTKSFGFMQPFPAQPPQSHPFMPLKKQPAATLQQSNKADKKEVQDFLPLSPKAAAGGAPARQQNNDNTKQVPFLPAAPAQEEPPE